MPSRERRMRSGSTALQESSETISSDAVKMRPQGSTLSQSVKAAATASPTESEVAAAAYQLWLDEGCPVGSDREDWFRAEAMLKNADAAKGTGIKMLVEFRWEGHWEAWESEWGGARWIWD